MATYRSIATTETDPEAPLTSALMKALEANPTAIAEGAADAPRIQAGAIQTYIGRVALSGTTPVVITGLNPNCVIAITGGFTNGVGDTSQISMDGSSDGGATWGTPVALTGTMGGVQALAAVSNLKNGNTESAAGFQDIGNNINAVRFQLSAAVVGAGAVQPRFSVYYIGLAP